MEYRSYKGLLFSKVEQNYAAEHALHPISLALAEQASPPLQSL
jgi:hypothetical protein